MSNLRKNGLSGQNISMKNNIIYKQKNKNFNLMQEICRYLNSNNFDYCLEIIDIGNRLYKYNYVKGITLNTIMNPPKEKIFLILDIVNKMQDLSQSQNKIIVHGDLSPTNFIFNDNLDPIKIIDWDSCHYGNKYEDIAYICWLWVRFADDKNKTDENANLLKNIFTYLNFTSSEIENVKINLIELIAREKNKAKNHKYLMWYRRNEHWIKENWGKIYE